MGRDISSAEFSDEDFRVFKQRLREESLLLMDWFKSDSFEDSREMCGFELEMWLVDKSFIPSPTNDAFLASVNSHLVVPELSRFNFEINSTPHRFEGAVLSILEGELKTVWRKCEEHAERMQSNIIAIGILPSVQNEMLNLQNMSPLNRYFALNRQILNLREGRPIEMSIDGKDKLRVNHRDVMLEAVTTSLQIHIQVRPREAVRHYNTAHILSAPMVAVAANSPFLFCKDLWDETRIPAFEQAIAVASFRDTSGNTVERVTFGTGYSRHSLMEPFLENLDGFPVLLPLIYDDDPTWLSHLRLHNGTIWRWNRPLIGLDDRARPHLRIEHRVAAAGPTTVDTIANIALFMGLMHYYVHCRETPLEHTLTFETARKNFYRAARYGLNTRIQWEDGQDYPLRSLLLEVLVPAAKEGLRRADLLREDIQYYLDKIIQPRIATGRNGAAWQREYINKHGLDFLDMTGAYHANQKTHAPVHEWTV